MLYDVKLYLQSLGSYHYKCVSRPADLHLELPRNG